MDVSILDAAFYYDAQMRMALRRVAGALLRRIAAYELVPAGFCDGQQFAPKPREPSVMRDARAMAAVVALMLAEPPACPLDADYVWKTARAAREAAEMFEPANGADTHVAFAVACVCAASTTMQLHDAARMLARLPPRYNPFLMTQYGLAAVRVVEYDSPPSQDDADALWAPAVGVAKLNHQDGSESTWRPADWGARAAAAVMELYLNGGMCKNSVAWGDGRELPRAVDPSEDEADRVATHKAKGPYTEDDVAREMLEVDVELQHELREMRMTLLNMSRERIKLSKKPDMGYEATMDWINMLAIQHALAEGLCPNQAPWNAIRDVVRKLFDALHWYFDAPDLPPGAYGLSVLLRAETVAQFHDGVRMFARLAPDYRAAPPPEHDTVAREATRKTLRALRDLKANEVSEAK